MVDFRMISGFFEQIDRYLDPQRCEILVTKVFSGEKGDNNLILGTYPKKSNKAPSTCSSPK